MWMYICVCVYLHVLVCFGKNIPKILTSEMDLIVNRVYKTLTIKLISFVKGNFIITLTIKVTFNCPKGFKCNILTFWHKCLMQIFKTFLTLFWDKHRVMESRALAVFHSIYWMFLPWDHAFWVAILLPITKRSTSCLLIWWLHIHVLSK